MLQKTTAQKKIAKLRKRIRIVQGGTSASKTFTIIPFLITYAINTPNKVISVVSESMPHLKRGAMKDFLGIMKMTGNFTAKKWNISTSQYHFDNGSYIEFFSADQPDKMRGSRRDVLFMNECNNMSFETYHQLAIRTKDFIYLDYNPSSEFWVHTELLADPDTDFIILTYKDNEALDPSLVKEIEKSKMNAFFNPDLPDHLLFANSNIKSDYWSNWWRVYGMGQTGMLQGVIFKDWKIIDRVPPEARLLGGGIDFGYSGDPAAGVLVYKYNNTIILDEVLYQTEKTNREIYNELKNFGASWVADSAEPKSIRELQLYGLKVVGVDSKDTNFGIQLMQTLPIYMTKRSVNLIKEQRSYCWSKNRAGDPLDKPIDKWNHLLDAARYFLTNNMRGGYGKYAFGH